MKQCPEYSDLTIVEKKELIVKIQTLMASDCFYFRAVTQLIKTGEHFGLLDNVKILSEGTYLPTGQAGNGEA